MTAPLTQPSAPRHGIWRLEIILLLALLTTALGAGGVLHFLKWQHDKQAHLAATETVLQEGEALLDTLNGLSMARPPPHACALASVLNHRRQRLLRAQGRAVDLGLA
jgi:hypothetical protein